MSWGSGITPMLSMTRYFVDLSLDVDIVFIHNAQSPNDLISKDELEFYQQNQSNFKRHFICDVGGNDWVGPSGFLSSEMLLELVPDFKNREIYCCGPEPYMQNAKKILGSYEFVMSSYHQESFDIES